MISRRRGYRLREGCFVHSLGTTPPNPWLRNTASLSDWTSERWVNCCSGDSDGSGRNYPELLTSINSQSIVFFIISNLQTLFSTDLDEFTFSFHSTLCCESVCLFCVVMLFSLVHQLGFASEWGRWHRGASRLAHRGPGRTERSTPGLLCPPSRTLPSPHQLQGPLWDSPGEWGRVI